MGGSSKVLGTIKFGKNKTKQNKSTTETKEEKEDQERGKIRSTFIYFSSILFTYFDQRFCKVGRYFPELGA